jgi:hypothetical protein
LQKISYAKSKSHFVAKLDGTFKIPNTSGAATVEQTELQQSIFNAPPPGSAPAPSGLPAKPSPAVDSEMKDADSENRGQKRTRDEEEDESEEDVAMEEDSDDE